MSSRTRRNLPSTKEVLALPASSHCVTPTEWEDMNGHVTVPAHYEFHMRSVTVELQRLGWTENYLERHGKTLFSVEQHLSFYDEVLIGQEVSTHIRLLNHNERMLHGISILVNRATGVVANTVEFIEGHVDLNTRRTIPFEPELRDSLARCLIEHRRLPWSVPLNSGMGLR